MTRRGVCKFCRQKLDYLEQMMLGGGLELVPCIAQTCITRPGSLCEVETAGDRMVADIAKRNSRRRGFRR